MFKFGVSLFVVRTDHVGASPVKWKHLKFEIQSRRRMKPKRFEFIFHLIC